VGVVHGSTYAGGFKFKTQISSRIIEIEPKGRRCDTRSTKKTILRSHTYLPAPKSEDIASEQLAGQLQSPHNSIIFDDHKYLTMVRTCILCFVLGVLPFSAKLTLTLTSHRSSSPSSLFSPSWHRLLPLPRALPLASVKACKSSEESTKTSFGTTMPRRTFTTLGTPVLHDRRQTSTPLRPGRATVRMPRATTLVKYVESVVRQCVLYASRVCILPFVSFFNKGPIQGPHAWRRQLCYYDGRARRIGRTCGQPEGRKRAWMPRMPNVKNDRNGLLCDVSI
jgi:hypothetical protein